ncbi:hypothetical protein GCM10009837_16330 [Streptomyces durmitorensis]
MGYGFLTGAAEGQGGDAREGEEQNRKHGDGGTYATQQGHVGSSADLVPPLRTRSGQGVLLSWSDAGTWGDSGDARAQGDAFRRAWTSEAPKRMYEIWEM